MAAKIGRPSDDPKIHHLLVRLSEEDRQKLEYCARVTGRSRAEIIRDGLDNIYKQIRESNVLDFVLIKTCEYCKKQFQIGSPNDAKLFIKHVERCKKKKQ